MRPVFLSSGLLAAGLLIAGTIGAPADHLIFTPQTCIRAPHDQLCWHFPDDQIHFSSVLEYRLINTAAQDPFDHHAWQAFVALNWPLSPDGTPAAALATAPEAKRIWSRFARRDDVFKRNFAATCPDSADATVYTRDLAQFDGTVLIDQAGNFVVYETRKNPVVEAYSATMDSTAGPVRLRSTLSRSSFPRDGSASRQFPHRCCSRPPGGSCRPEKPATLPRPA